MSLLGNLITQVARQAMNPEDAERNPINQRVEPHRTGGLGDILGSVLGGSSAQSNTRAPSGGGFGMDDILGSVLKSQMGGSNAGGAGGLGSILGSVLGGGNTGGMDRSGMGGGKGMLVAALMPIVLSWIQRNGGLSGALSKIQGMGNSNQVQSWMSTEQENENLDPNEIDRLFDSQEIQQVAQQTGADESEVRQGISELLPEVFNQLTPTGGLDKEQEANNEINEILSQISANLPK